MPDILIAHHKTPVGELILGAFGGDICLMDWRYRKMRTTIDKRIQTGLGAGYAESGAADDSAVLEHARQQLAEYFEGSREAFDLPLRLVGTDFQQSVWRSLQTIPYGETIGYQALADKLGNPKAVRAVATANGANAISIVVPCHRVIGSDGQLVGYAGGLDAKKKLLQLEVQQGFELTP